jgi:GGDEF domain-containing protein
VRNYDAVGRHGGEEFLIVLRGCGAPDLVVSAERLRHSIADSPIETSAGQLSVTVSFGLACAGRAEKETLARETFLHAADEALYAAKAGGPDSGWKSLHHRWRSGREATDRGAVVKVILPNGASKNPQRLSMRALARWWTRLARKCH